MTTIQPMPIPAETLRLLGQASTATITMQLLKRGFRGLAIAGVRPMNPAAARFAGTPAVSTCAFGVPAPVEPLPAPKP